MFYRTVGFFKSSRIFQLRSFSDSSSSVGASVLLNNPSPTSDSTVFTPRQMVEFLDQHIIGQSDAKRAVAVAIRQRWRRKQIQDAELREDVMPKNILMIGPTGVGKTEIARKLAKMVDAPFIKVEATKFTEVGFQGRDVDQIIRDLLEISIKNQRQKMEAIIRDQALTEVNEKLLNELVPTDANTEEERQSWRQLLLKGELDEHEITLSNLPIVPAQEGADGSPGGQQQQQNAGTQTLVVRLRGSQVSGMDRSERLKVKDARARLLAAEVHKKVNQQEVIAEAIRSVEEDGIVVIDEIDKIVTKAGRSTSSPDASDEGVQRDLLPIVEGTTIGTKHGNVRTDHILFVGAGAFAAVKPSDMISELQGRFPVRVELKPLGEIDLRRILTEPKHNLIRQQKALFETEGVELEVATDVVNRIAQVAYKANLFIVNIGARRLGTIVEKLTETLSFDIPELALAAKEKGEGKPAVVIKMEDIDEVEKNLLTKQDLRKFIL